MLMFCTTYLIIFGILVGLTGQGSLVFSTEEVIVMVATSGALAITLAVAGAMVSGFGILGSGSPEAGRYLWKGALFALIMIWAMYFVLKISGLMPMGTPIPVSALLLGPPVVGILWGMFTVWHGGRE